MLQPGDAIDIWVVEAALGSGGMGSVYRCHNRNASRIMAAIKVLEGGLRRYPEAEARFVREAEILFQLDHPNIVKVRNIRTETEPPYLEMEFVAGESLDERLRRGPLPYADAVGYMRQCADAVAYLHAKGIRHRDIKPANLLVQKDGRVKLVDFGLAVEQDTTRITQAGMAFGTVSYAPPEWVTPESMDPVKWDVYALGVVFYEMLTGRFAFPVSGTGTARQQAMQVIIAKQNHAPLDPGPSFHDDVRALVADMTRSDAATRPSDVGALVARTQALVPELRGAAGVTLAPTPRDVPVPTASLDEIPTPAPPVAVPHPAGTVRPPAPKPAERSMTRVALAAFGGIGALLAGATALVLALAVGLWWWARSPAGPRPVEVVVEGADLVPVDVTLAGERATPVGARLVFPSVAVGPAELRWAAGPECTVAACPGDGCPPWCTHGREALEVPPGADPLGHVLAVVTPAPREVAIALPGLAGSELPVRAALGGREGVRGPDGVSFAAVPPGRHALEVTAECPDCARKLDVVVPIEGPAVPASLDLAPPAPVVEAPKPSAPRPSGRGLVTIADLAAWLAQNPDYAPGGPFAAKGGAGYLRGWTAAGPPAGRKGSEPVTGVSAALAIEFCKRRGGLPGIDADPKVPATAYEVRVDGNVVRLLEDLGDGTARAVPTDAVRATSGASFRCAR